MELKAIEDLPILDKEAAIIQLDGVELFESLLMGFDDMSMKSNLADLKAALENVDYANIRLSSHSLKGSSSYIHAERVKVITSMIQTAVDNNKYEDIYKYYPVLIKQCILLKRRIRYEACIKEGKEFEDDSSDFDVPIAKNYKVIKRSENDFDVVQVAGNTTEAKMLQSETKDQMLLNDRTQKRRSNESTLNGKNAEMNTNEVAKIACCTCVIF